jgi:hypothetical protein
VNGGATAKRRPPGAAPEAASRPGLLVVGEISIEDAIDKANLKSEKQVKRHVHASSADVDDSAKQLD